MIRRAPGQPFEIRHPGSLGHQCRTRLETHIVTQQVRIVVGDIRRIGNDEIEAMPGQRREPVAFEEASVGDGQLPGIGLREGHGVRGEIDAGDPPARAFAGKGQRDGAGTGAQIEQLASGPRAKLERHFYQAFGIRPRNQGRRRGLEAKPPELPRADQVRYRQPLDAPGDQLLEGLVLGCRQLPIAPGIEPGPVRLADIGQQHFRIEPRRRRHDEAPCRLAQGVIDRHHSPCNAAS